MVHEQASLLILTFFASFFTKEEPRNEISYNSFTYSLTPSWCIPEICPGAGWHTVCEQTLCVGPVHSSPSSVVRESHHLVEHCEQPGWEDDSLEYSLFLLWMETSLRQLSECWQNWPQLLCTLVTSALASTTIILWPLLHPGAAITIYYCTMPCSCPPLTLVI